MIKAINTKYKGYNFRSRLEARWAVFLDSLGIKWEYEFEGFELNGTIRYLPDFYLPEEDLYLEIKPKELNREEMNKINLMNLGGKKIVYIIGTPNLIEAYKIFYQTNKKLTLDWNEEVYNPYKKIIWTYPSDSEIENYNGKIEKAIDDAKSYSFEFKGGKDGDEERSRKRSIRISRFW